jgi:hypothetical protein
MKIARAVTANARPTSAQTIQDGKYEPTILSEGGPSQQPKKTSGAAHHNRTAAECSRDSPVWENLWRYTYEGGAIGLFSARTPPVRERV